MGQKGLEGFVVRSTVAHVPPEAHHNPTVRPWYPLVLLHIGPTHLEGHPEKVLIVFHLEVHVEVPGVVDSV